ncbi:unnamed protein product [Prunus brigantina]
MAKPLILHKQNPISHKLATITFPTPNTKLEQNPCEWTKSCNKIMVSMVDCSTCFKNTMKTKVKSWVDNTTLQPSE